MFKGFDYCVLSAFLCIVSLSFDLCISCVSFHSCVDFIFNPAVKLQFLQ